MNNQSRINAGNPSGGQFSVTTRTEPDVGLAGVRNSSAFLAAMETAEHESRVRNVNEGDWVRMFGDDEYGVVESVGLHELETDEWTEFDTDEGDLVVNVVPKAVGDRIFAEASASKSDGGEGK